MNRLKKIFPLVLFSLIGCTTSGSSTHEDNDVIRIEGSEMIILGRLTLAQVELSIDNLTRANTSIDFIRVKSPGGDAEAALILANFLLDMNTEFTLVVEDHCLSSCSNYLVPIAAQIHLLEGAILGWHGGAFSDYSEAPLEWKDSALKEWRAKEESFFERLGVCEHINSFGERYVPLRLFKPYRGWAYSQLVLRELGVDSILVYQDYESSMASYQDNDIYVVNEIDAVDLSQCSASLALAI